MGMFGKPTWRLHPRMDSSRWKEGVLLKNVMITFPTPTKEEPEVANCESGDTSFYRSDGEFQWVLGELEGGSEGALEYLVSGVDLEDLWPISVHFEIEETYSQIEVESVKDVEGEAVYEHSVRHSCVADKYNVE